VKVTSCLRWVKMRLDLIRLSPLAVGQLAIQ
jgi:hypothetical protein